MRGEQTINVPSLRSIIGSSPPILFTLHAISYNNYHHRSFNILQTINLCERILYDSRESFRGIDGKKEGKAKGKPSAQEFSTSLLVTRANVSIIGTDCFDFEILKVRRRFFERSKMDTSFLPST